MRGPTDKPSKQTTVLVTGVGGRSVGFQILQALLDEQSSYRVVVCDADPNAYGLYCVKARYQVPKVNDPEAYLKSVYRLIRDEAVDIIVPGTEIELRFLSNNLSALEPTGVILLASSSSVIETCLNKANAARWMVENGVGTPRTAEIDTWETLAEGCGFPIIAKPTDVTGGSRNVEVLADPDEVKDYITRFPRDPKTLLFQEYVGTSESEYTVGVLTHADGSIIDSFVLKRVLSGLSLQAERVIDGERYAISTGYSQGVVVRDQRIQKFCESLAMKLKVTGPLNIQLRVHNDGSIKVFEMHPRFSGTTSIRAQAGFNEVDLAIRSFLHGERFGRQTYQSDVLAMRSFQNQLTPLTQITALPNCEI